MLKYTRRDFLKFAAMTPVALTFSRLFSSKLDLNPNQSSTSPNVIFLVFDAMSAYHLSLYGYHRKTTPNLERFAKRANVYNAHYSPANFTVPGVASILTGLYPWSHRALQLSGLITRDLTDHNLFELMGTRYHRFGFSQNVYATNLMNQFRSGIDELLPSSSFSDISFLPSEFFKNDPLTAHQVDDNLLFDFIDPPGSLLFGIAQRLYFERKKRFDRDFPRGIPQPRNYPIVYRLEDVFDGLFKTFDNMPNPFFSYIHIFSPHAPYRARRDFIGIFDDGWAHTRKPEHIFSEGEAYETIEQNRIWYDEYIANVDFEFGRLLNYLEGSGLLTNSYLVVTSDHGELLERGIKGHVTPVLYEPLVRIPLIISSPAQMEGRYIDIPTVSIDLLPTLLNGTGHDVPIWAEGTLLPGLGGNENPEREIYMLEAKSNSAFAELTRATFAMRKSKYKIIMYRGYAAFEGDAFELYDLENDPEEINNLYTKQPRLADEMREVLLRKFGLVSRL